MGGRKFRRAALTCAHTDCIHAMTHARSIANPHTSCTLVLEFSARVSAQKITTTNRWRVVITLRGRMSDDPKKQENTQKTSRAPWQHFMSVHAGGREVDEGGVAGPKFRTPHLDAKIGQYGRDLRATLHSEAYQQRLESAWKALRIWFSTMYRTFTLGDVIHNAECACVVLCRYIQHLHDYKAKVTLAVETLLSAQWRHRNLRGCLTEPWDLIVSWKKELPLRMRTPLPLPLVQGLFRWCMARGLGCAGGQAHLWVRFAISLLVGFHALLRPCEIYGILRACVGLPSEILPFAQELESPRASLVIIEPKNWRHAGRHQVAFLSHGPTISWLRWLTAGMPDMAYVFPSLLQARKLLASAVDGLHLMGLGICLASLRAGGATELFKSTANLPIVQYAGRWASLRTLAHYIQEASAAQTLVRVGVETRALVHELHLHMQILDTPPTTRRMAILSNAQLRIAPRPPPAIAHLLSHVTPPASQCRPGPRSGGTPARRARSHGVRPDAGGRVDQRARGGGRSRSAEAVRLGGAESEPHARLLPSEAGVGGVAGTCHEVRHPPGPSAPANESCYSANPLLDRSAAGALSDIMPEASDFYSVGADDESDENNEGWTLSPSRS